MAQLISGGNAAIQALLYGDTHPGTRRYFESQRGQGYERLTQTARTFAVEAAERFGFMASDRTKRLIANVRRKADWAWHGDYIRPLRTVDELQLAAPTMMRYVMAEPFARRMYHQQQLAGYDELYVDDAPGMVGEDHREYRHVMDGIIQTDTVPDAEGHYGWHADQYLDDYLPDEHELDFTEQLDILETWAHLRSSIAQRLRDPTSLYGASLE